MPVSDEALGLVSRLAVQGFSRVTGPRLSILIFHRVLATPDRLFPAEMDAARFDRLMALVARIFTVLPLADAVQSLRQGNLPANALSITFDDGYADNFDIALPILKRHGLSACFFIATGFLDGGRMFNDSVIECVRASPLQRLDLAEFGLGQVDLQTPAQRTQAIGRILPLIKYLGQDERQAALLRLQRQCRPPGLPDNLMMSRAQVRALHAAGMEIGAHTVSHPILELADDAQAEAEIRDSRSLLEGLLDRPVSLFAYPNGQPGRDYSHRHAAIVKRQGFAAAVSTAAGVARPGDDCYQLPRFTPWDLLPQRWIGRLVAGRLGRSFDISQPATA